MDASPQIEAGDDLAGDDDHSTASSSRKKIRQTPVPSQDMTEEGDSPARRPASPTPSSAAPAGNPDGSPLSAVSGAESLQHSPGSPSIDTDAVNRKRGIGSSTQASDTVPEVQPPRKRRLVRMAMEESEFESPNGGAAATAFDELKESIQGDAPASGLDLPAQGSSGAGGAPAAELNPASVDLDLSQATPGDAHSAHKHRAGVDAVDMEVDDLAQIETASGAQHSSIADADAGAPSETVAAEADDAEDIAGPRVIKRRMAVRLESDDDD